GEKRTFPRALPAWRRGAAPGRVRVRALRRARVGRRPAAGAHPAAPRPRVRRLPDRPHERYTHGPLDDPAAPHEDRRPRERPGSGPRGRDRRLRNLLAASLHGPPRPAPHRPIERAASPRWRRRRTRQPRPPRGRGESAAPSTGCRHYRTRERGTRDPTWPLRVQRGGGGLHVHGQGRAGRRPGRAAGERRRRAPRPRAGLRPFERSHRALRPPALGPLPRRAGSLALLRRPALPAALGYVPGRPERGTRDVCVHQPGARDGALPAARELPARDLRPHPALPERRRRDL
ncbi:MAG: hypothetical protein AVDCRST_MAG25-1371, partial [uncultured Rubrobacteraceae bacterium]